MLRRGGTRHCLVCALNSWRLLLVFFALVDSEPPVIFGRGTISVLTESQPHQRRLDHRGRSVQHRNIQVHIAVPT